MHYHDMGEAQAWPVGAQGDGPPPASLRASASEAERLHQRLEHAWQWQQEHEFNEALQDYYVLRTTHQAQQQRLNQVLYGYSPSCQGLHSQPQQPQAAVMERGAPGGTPPQGSRHPLAAINLPLPFRLQQQHQQQQQQQQQQHDAWKAQQQAGGGGMHWEAAPPAGPAPGLPPTAPGVALHPAQPCARQEQLAQQEHTAGLLGRKRRPEEGEAAADPKRRCAG